MRYDRTSDREGDRRPEPANRIPPRRRRRPGRIPAGPASLLYPPPSIWRNEPELVVWCPDGDLIGANTALTVGDEITYLARPLPSGFLEAMFGPAAEPVEWALELYMVTFPRGVPVTEISGHISALRAVACPHQRDAEGHFKPVPGTGMKTPVSTTNTPHLGRTRSDRLATRPCSASSSLSLILDAVRSS